MTAPKRLKAFIAIAMHIYVLLHTKTSVKAFRLTREGLMVQEDKMTYGLKEERLKSFTNFFSALHQYLWSISQKSRG